MKKVIISCISLLMSISVLAQDIEKGDSLVDINAIKRDTSFIYAESTMKDAVEAMSGAYAVLELKLHDWLSCKHPGMNAELLISNSKGKWADLLTRRGNYKRAFVYVRKSDVISDVKQEEIGEENISHQDKIAFIKHMYMDFFENESFNCEKLSDLLKYLTPEVANQIHIECPYDGYEGDSSYVVNMFIDGSPTYERSDPGTRVVVRTIKPLENDWYVVSNIWDVVETPINIGLKVQVTDKGLRVVDISTERDNKIDGLSPLNDATEECELFLTPEEDKMVTLISFYEIEPYIKGLKADERINGYGKYSTMPENGSIYLFIYNKEGEIVAVLFKNHKNIYNLKTRKKDTISNYKNCGAIWFSFNF